MPRIRVIMTKIQAIREEFQEPFRDVIKGFAEMGYSRVMTARILDMSNSYLEKLCKVYNLNRYWKPVMERRPECRGKGISKPRKYTDAELFGYVRQYPELSKFKELAPVDHGTIYYRFKGYSWEEITRMANNGIG